MDDNSSTNTANENIRLEYKRMNERAWREAIHTFGSYPTPRCVKRQLDEEFSERPENVEESAWRMQKSLRKLELKMDHCINLAMSISSK